jgi:hypothetical protein
MQIQVDIGFEELLKAVERLPEDQRLRFKEVLENRKVKRKEKVAKPDESIEAFLLRGPTFSEEQIKAIEATQKALNRWRKK